MLRDYLNMKLDLNDKATKKYFYINLLIIAIMYLVAVVFLGKLPVQIPIMHDGPKQIYIDSKLGVFLIPTVALVTNVLANVQKRLYFYYTILYILVLIGMSYYYYTLI
ncbi:SdpI family protein [Granulicatella seriolae]|uniref:DUF1648 domain-containing protein n=1 Tax=Granulicatella seriolae TaxID=2967226 RepID=A0ABT1WQN6_9LACT|nr:hypothetical protein [Granulicatella seriolae]